MVVHPQSIVHSLVEYVDGSVLAQLGNPDMRTPIAQALAWPERLASGVQSSIWCEAARLDFEAPDLRALSLPRAGHARRREAGGTAPAVLNAANEVAVAGLPGRAGLNFAGIARGHRGGAERQRAPAGA